MVIFFKVRLFLLDKFLVNGRVGRVRISFPFVRDAVGLGWVGALAYHRKRMDTTIKRTTIQKSSRPARLLRRHILRRWRKFGPRDFPRRRLFGGGLSYAAAPRVGKMGNRRRNSAQKSSPEGAAPRHPPISLTVRISGGRLGFIRENLGVVGNLAIRTKPFTRMARASAPCYRAPHNPSA